MAGGRQHGHAERCCAVAHQPVACDKVHGRKLQHTAPVVDGVLVGRRRTGEELGKIQHVCLVTLREDWALIKHKGQNENKKRTKARKKKERKKKRKKEEEYG